MEWRFTLNGTLAESKSVDTGGIAARQRSPLAAVGTLSELQLNVGRFRTAGAVFIWTLSSCANTAVAFISIQMWVRRLAAFVSAVTRRADYGVTLGFTAIICVSINQWWSWCACDGRSGLGRAATPRITSHSDRRDITRLYTKEELY